MNGHKIRDRGNANQQVTDAVKDRINDQLEEYGVTDPADTVLKTHFRQGEYVAVSLRDPIEDITAWNEWMHNALGYWRNKRVGDDVIWVHKEWIDQHLFGGQ